jgi:hypothetical protein
MQTKKTLKCPRELSSTGRGIAFYMHGPGFEPRTPHLSTLRVEFLALSYLTNIEV